MSKVYYCPDCGEKLKAYSGCASINYFCEKCNSLKSSKRILEEPPNGNKQEKK
ncbi:zinc-ribbon domain-containing protein [Clostridium sp. MB40-C1]|uniref:YfgJ family double zinc ribbon protein n=1 Tax=Clostridium sp. MB40-C1 TaxID=3070996 RepID=UPI0027E184B3|nr:zinc-ribbon domain-containing protein [Clostridium sp. MB40-C1]WMJ79197.1 zinc-ribbon domain-containing protein [Clostridium sp. MB40-C1]